ncbi:DNA topoisomerase I-like protein [Luteibacter rhizovicinus]|uniref:DNA topoisomerase n=2 Tax=Luteibacter rhizovicinus TaxID=242606 RepID=A0A4R3YX53_9GAMM|nr:DNA topoisomerase I-like protein [Luteibacter rhizovicinus]
MTDFAAVLPQLRRHVRHDLALPGLPRDKVLALVVRLLDETLIRVGNESYANDNGSYGLTTLRSRHVQLITGQLQLAFRAKSGKESHVLLKDKHLMRLVRRMHQLPGQRLFQFIDEEGQRRPIDSEMVNSYIRDISGGDFTAKDFRTWKGTLLAIILLSRTPPPRQADDAALRTIMTDAIKQVAERLRNTPAVCRASYIHPTVFDGWRNGRLRRVIPEKETFSLRQMERRSLRFLKLSVG